MAAAACRLEDIFDAPDPKTNERLNETKRLLRIPLEQQAKSSASRCRASPSQPSQTMATANGGHSDARTPLAEEGSGNLSDYSSDRPRTKGAQPR
jgi:hypothetical protein